MAQSLMTPGALALIGVGQDVDDDSDVGPGVVASALRD